MPTPTPRDKSVKTESLRELVAWPWTLEETEGGNYVLFNVVDGGTRSVSDTASSVNETLDAYQPQYEALSYTWGDADASKGTVAEVEDIRAAQEPPTELHLRPNLATALRYLRHSEEVRVLWIDAICINQEDIEERNRQVQRMTYIYKHARRVVAWLGEESDDSKHALATLRHVGQQLESTKSGRIIAAPHATERRLWRNDQPPAFNRRTWQAVRAFVERAWFYRLWCWQEINLGGRNALLQCGNDTISWRDFWLATVCLHNKDKTASMWFRERSRHIAFLKHDASTNSMSNILAVCKSKGCADPRDKIYGLLGITPASFSARIRVDYLRPVEDVYKDAFLAHVHMTSRLELLRHCDLADRKVGGPSWVPDWSQSDFAAPILNYQLSAGISRAWFSYVQPDVLEVVGKHCTTIGSVSGTASKSLEATLLAVKEWYSHLPSAKVYPTGEPMEQAFALTLCMDRTRERHPYSHFLSASEWVGMLHRMLRLTAASLDDPLYSERESANTVQKMRGRRFFTTVNGYIGIAPAGAQVGDSICLLLGTYAPIILRQTASGSFQVVGEAYVHGLSNGVGILGSFPPRWEVLLKGDAMGRPTQRFLDTRTGLETLEDPRLGNLPPGWERVPYQKLDDDPDILERFRNMETGEVVNSDPRLSPHALAARGVKLQSFRLV
ncbi:hypothetical protein VTK56DRAFT_1771 [Thermocarpiscus australiensis]